MFLWLMWSGFRGAEHGRKPAFIRKCVVAGLPLIVMAWCLLLLNVQRVLPFVRNWMPLMPLYFATASAGLIYAGKSIAERLRRRYDFSFRLSASAACVLVLALAALLASLTIVTETAYQKDEMGDYTRNTTRDAEEIALFLKDKLVEGDVVFSDTDYIAVPLEYYFIKYGISLDYLAMKVPDVRDFPVSGSQCEQRATWDPLGWRPGGPEGLRRAFFIVAEKEEHTLEDSLAFAITEEGGLKLEYFYDSATPVMDTGFTELLVTYRKADAASEQEGQ